LPTGKVEVTACGGSVVAGNAAVAPAEVVGGREIREVREPLRVAKVEAGFDQPCWVDDEGRLAVFFLGLDYPRYALVAQVATPRIS
jgi:hypothetical protein